MDTLAHVCAWGVLLTMIMFVFALRHIMHEKPEDSHREWQERRDL